MENVTEKIRAEATKLLEKGEVDLVIGFREGSIPLTSRPWFARTPGTGRELHWDGFLQPQPLQLPDQAGRTHRRRGQGVRQPVHRGPPEGKPDQARTTGDHRMSPVGGCSTRKNSLKRPKAKRSFPPRKKTDRSNLPETAFPCRSPERTRSSNAVPSASTATRSSTTSLIGNAVPETK